MAACGTTIFGASSQYIRILGGDFVAIEGANTVEKLITNDLKIPYDQIVKSRVVLKAGQVNYLLNLSGVGDSATFVLIRATYDPNSTIEEDNYVQWSFYDSLTTVNYMDNLMLLTGNSTHRIKQIYMTNPNSKYNVTLDVMMASIDETYAPFTDTLNQTGTTFVNLNYTDIKTYVVGESIVIYDKRLTPLPLIYIQLSSINSIQKTGNILIINDVSIGTIFLQFVTEYDAYQAQSLLNYVINNPNVNINTLNPVADSVSPVVYFWSNVGNTFSGNYISFNGATSGVPYDTSYGVTFSTSISLSQFGLSGSVIDKPTLSSLLINNVVDNRDGVINIIPDVNLLISSATASGTMSCTMSSVTDIGMITATGSYVMSFNLKDIAQNCVYAMVDLNITS